MGHSKPTQCYDGSGSSGNEVSKNIFSQSSIDVVPLNEIGAGLGGIQSALHLDTGQQLPVVLCPPQFLNDFYSSFLG